jgi:hypothetical protein
MVEEATPKPAAGKPEPFSESARMAILCAVGAVLANGVFFILSFAYYNAHKLSAPGVGDFVDEASRTSARESFLVLSLVVAALSFIATRLPREVGHGIATMLGFAALAASYGAFDKGLPTVMGVTLLVVGVLMPTLAYLSWHKSRAAWSFLIALVAVFGGVTLFGAPKVRGMLGIGLWTAMIVPALKIVATVALASTRRDYRSQT